MRLIENLRPSAHQVLDRLLGPRSPDRWRPVFRARDLRVMVALAAAQVCAWVVPPSSWDRAARGLTGFFINSRDSADPARVRTAQASAFEIKIQTLAARRGTWNPTVEWHGLEQIRAALLKQKGVVLWMVNTDFDSSVGKWACHEAGLAVHHLSRAEHGFSDSRFGLRYLNPIRTRVEDRWLGGRIRVEGKADGAMRRAWRVLGSGGIISIKTGDFEGSGVIEVACDGHVLRVGSGAPGLCHLQGSTLFVVSVLRISGQRYRIDAGRPMDVNRSLDRETASLRCAESLAERIATINRLHPGLWRGQFAKKTAFSSQTRTRAGGQ